MYRKSVTRVVVCLIALGLASWLCAAEGAAPSKAPAAKAAAPRPTEEPDDGIQGLYVGTLGGAKAEARVIGLKDKTYKVILTAGEGEGAVKVELNGKLDGGKVVLAGAGGETATIADKKLTGEAKGPKFELTYTVPKSPTEGAKPPAGAIVLLAFEPGKAPLLDAWSDMKGGPAAWLPQDDGSLLVKGGNIKTRKDFGNVRLHVEFRCPYMPAGTGQGRGNSGVYLQSRYETQVLDSFGLAPKDNECGGIYSVSAPKVMASFPPGVWQTYDITFRAPKVADGKIVEPAVATVAHNGVMIHENVKIDHVTTAGVSGPIVSPAPLMLQDHGNPVRFRNIWLEELK
jgi:hypothetical protein